MYMAGNWLAGTHRRTTCPEINGTVGDRAAAQGSGRLRDDARR